MHTPLKLWTAAHAIAPVPAPGDLTTPGEFRVHALAGGPGHATATVFFNGWFRATCIVQPHRTLLMLDGEFDLDSVNAFAPALAAARAHCRAIDIDCSGITFIDS